MSRRQSSVDRAPAGLPDQARGATVDELAPINVNAVPPGVVRTALWDAMTDFDRQAMYDQAAPQLPLGGVGEVADAA